MKEETQKEKQLIKFLTEYKKEDGMYAGHVFAETWKEAEELAKQKGETIYGYIPPDCLDCEQELELGETQKNPNEVANEIFTQHLEGKSYGFVKHVLEIMNNHLDIICIVPTLPK